MGRRRQVLVGLALVGAVLLLAWLASPAPAPRRVPGAGPAALVVADAPLVTRPPGAAGTVFAAGRVRNTAARPYSGQITVTLFGPDGRLVGTAVGYVNDVAAGDEVTYQAMGPVPEDAAWARAEAKVSLQLPR